MAAASAPREHRSADGVLRKFNTSSKQWEVVQEDQQHNNEDNCTSSRDEGAPLLALPGKQYPFQYDGKDFQINGKFIRLPNGEESRRHPEDQQDADTADSVWDSSVVLAKLIEHNPTLVKGKRVLELGSGTGLGGISAALCGGKQVTLTDLPYAMPLLNRSITLNGVGDVVRAEVLDWANPPNTALHPRFDLIIASDVIWLESLVPLLANIIAEKELVPLLMVHQTRSTRCDQLFKDLLKARGFRIDKLEERLKHPYFLGDLFHIRAFLIDTECKE
ncbi:hypothetical protein FOL47_006636 [Perkinsus chesapeaki]|uniref:Uncharacterized protein n=1 Tax=Perkinsus chesapeaki TaxID=330153 RepID=A0A7J6LQP6_PERCH|nr:hypothetical protein FOL47_006636 [Perkinsus chesapeaki]